MYSAGGERSWLFTHRITSTQLGIQEHQQTPDPKPTTDMNFKQKTLFSWKSMFILIAISALIGFITYSYVSKSSRGQSELICPKEAKEENTDKHRSNVEGEDEELIILLWTWPRGYRFPIDKCAEHYGISGCNLTTDRSWYNRSHAVIFNYPDIHYRPGMGPKDPRPENQLWVWFSWESPRHTFNLHFMDNLINLTMSYKTDSDIYIPYGGIVKMRDPQNFIIPNKTKLVAWLTSNWDATMVRVAYYKELKQHLNISMYGSRGISRNTPVAPEKLHSTIAQYKFYLAFENSLSTDYITEKFWRNALMSGTVPVVLGTTRQNYERFVPGDAFIHVNDFPSAKDLAAYLHFLDSHEEQYRRYFRWRKWFQPYCDEGDWAKHYCMACQAMRQNPTYKTFPNISKWFKGP